MDLFLTNMQLLSSQDVNWVDYCNVDGHFIDRLCEIALHTLPMGQI